ncbi:MAG: YTH domain-containing protein, partial [Monoraphidium minutum]
MGGGGGPRGPRFFIIKSASLDNFLLSRRLGAWATQGHNEPKLDEAFRSGAEVVLIMSVNNTGHFQGVARMTTPIGGGPRAVPWVGLARPDSVRNFGVRWEVAHALPFAEARGIINPWNDGQPLRVGRDGQEVAPAAG